MREGGREGGKEGGKQGNSGNTGTPILHLRVLFCHMTFKSVSSDHYAPVVW